MAPLAAGALLVVIGLGGILVIDIATFVFAVGSILLVTIPQPARSAEGEASRRTFTEGYYVLGHFSLPTSKIVDFERPLKLNDTVLRYMLTLVDVHGQPVEDTVSDDQELKPDFEDNEE